MTGVVAVTQVIEGCPLKKPTVPDLFKMRKDFSR